MDANRFNQILIVDSIPSGESNSAKRLFEIVRGFAIEFAPSPAVNYACVASDTQLIELISRSGQLAREAGILPMLHIECHGNEHGLKLADGSELDWDGLKHPLAELNVATHLNLMIAVSACIGAALAKCLTLSDRAPFWGLIGPTEKLFPDDLERAFRELYVTLLRTKSPAEAVAAMEKVTRPGIFWRTTAQGLFERVWDNFNHEQMSPEALERWAERLRAKHIQQGGDPNYPTEYFKERLLDRSPKAYERFRRTFFMYDLFPEHEARFKVQSPES